MREAEAGRRAPLDVGHGLTTSAWVAAGSVQEVERRISSALERNPDVHGGVRGSRFRLWIPRSTQRGYAISSFGSLAASGDGTRITIRFLPEPILLVSLLTMSAILVALVMIRAWPIAGAMAVFLIAAILFVIRLARKERRLLSDFVRSI
jgi:hypothetical protein